MTNWPLLQWNKIEDSMIEEPVKIRQGSPDGTIKELAEKVCCCRRQGVLILTTNTQLLSHWATLEVGYRIPKRIKVSIHPR